MISRLTLILATFAACFPVRAQSDLEKVDLGNGVGLELVRIEPGEFQMGRPASQKGEFDEVLHPVRLTKAFYLGKYDVTQRQWQQLMGTNPSLHRNPDAPVDSVTWDDCQAFLERLNAYVSGKRFRLPTEAEWEYACRAGTATKWSFGDDEAMANDYVWYQGNSGNVSHPVGQKGPNPWGLMDMHGNVWQWCQDFYGPYKINPAGFAIDPVQTKGIYRVLRGGSFVCEARHARSARRFCYDPRETNSSFGFRIVQESQ